MSADTRARMVAVQPIPRLSRIYGFGSIYGKTIRDSRLAFIIAAGLLGGLALVMGAAISTVFPTPETRLEIDKLIGGMPPQMVNFFGKPVGLGHARRLHDLEVRPGVRARDLAVVDPRAVVHARRRGEPGQPRPRRHHAVRQAADRAREGRRPPDDARPGPGVLRRARGRQLQRLRRSPPSAIRSHRYRRSASPCGSASPPCSSAAWRSPWRRSLAAPARPALPASRWRCCGRCTAWIFEPLAALSPFRWTENHVALVGHVRLAGACPRRARCRGIPRHRRRAVLAARPRRHRRCRAARGSRRRCSGFAARSAARSAISCRAPSPGASASALMGAMLASLVGPMSAQLAGDANLLQVLQDGLPGLRPQLGGGLPPAVRRAVLHRRWLRRGNARLEVGVGRDRRPPRGGPGHAADARPMGRVGRRRRVPRRRDRHAAVRGRDRRAARRRVARPQDRRWSARSRSACTARRSSASASRSAGCGVRRSPPRSWRCSSWRRTSSTCSLRH